MTATTTSLAAPPLPPTVNDYTQVIQAWVDSNARDGAVRAANLLEKAERIVGNDHVVPIDAYAMVVRGFAQRQHPSAATDWMERLLAQRKNAPNEKSNAAVRKAFNACLYAWANQPTNRTSSQRRVPSPTRRSDTNAHVQKQKGGTHHNSDTTETSLGDSRHVGDGNSDGSSADRVLEILARFKTAGADDPTLRPDTFSYSTVLQVLARTGAANEAQALLAEMEASPICQPDALCYSFVIHALANQNRRHGNQQTALQAESILNKMVELNNGHCPKDSEGTNSTVLHHTQPNSYTYEGVIAAWAHSRTGTRGARRAAAILDHMVLLHQQGTHGVKPLTVCCNAVLLAW